MEKAFFLHKTSAGTAELTSYFGGNRSVPRKTDVDCAHVSNSDLCCSSKNGRHWNFGTLCDVDTPGVNKEQANVLKLIPHSLKCLARSRR